MMHELPRHGEIWVQPEWPNQQLAIINGLPDPGDSRTFGFNAQPELPGALSLNTSGRTFTQDELLVFLINHGFQNQGPFRELILMKGEN